MRRVLVLVILLAGVTSSAAEAHCSDTTLRGYAARAAEATGFISKGNSGCVCFALGFLLGPIGLFITAVLLSNRPVARSDSTATYELGQLSYENAKSATIASSRGCKALSVLIRSYSCKTDVRSNHGGCAP